MYYLESGTQIMYIGRAGKREFKYKFHVDSVLYTIKYIHMCSYVSIADIDIMVHFKVYYDLCT